MPTAQSVKRELANVWNFPACVGGCTVDGASGSDLHPRISWRCTSGEVEPSRWSKSAEGRSLWHKAPQAANSRNKMTRIGAIRFAITQSCKAASDFPAPRRFGWKHTSTLALARAARLSKFALSPNYLVMWSACASSCYTWVVVEVFNFDQ